MDAPSSRQLTHFLGEFLGSFGQMIGEFFQRVANKSCLRDYRAKTFDDFQQNFNNYLLSFKLGHTLLHVKYGLRYS